jgi:CRP-like cAMP-binding protein
VVEHHRVAVVFATCSPGHLPACRRLGLRTFGAQAISDDYGLLLPLIGLPYDLPHLERMGSPWLRPMRQLQREGKLPSPPDDTLQDFVRGATSVVLDTDRVAAEIGMVLSDARPTVLDSLSEETREHLARRGFVMEVEPGDVVVREGSADREMFIVLEGDLEVRARGLTVDGISRGELFGEVGLFHQEGGRRASVIASRRSRLLVIRRSTLRRLQSEAPSCAFELYEAVAAIMARRLAQDIEWLTPASGAADSYRGASS